MRNIIFFKATGGMSFMPSTIHHAIAHSLLFGSYEWIKRLLIRQFEQVEKRDRMNDEEEFAREGKNKKLRYVVEEPGLELEDDDVECSENNDDHFDNDILKIKATVGHQRENSQLNDGIESNVTNNEEDQEQKDDARFVKYSQLVSIAIAGGMAGSIQHITSHYSESLLLKERIIVPISNIHEASDTAVGSSKMNSLGGNKTKKSVPKKIARLPFLLQWHTLPSPPPLRSHLWVFLPSAIGFVAFEFGKDLA
eukprot:9104115-Ditylum_brightwellii.AAC.1